METSVSSWGPGYSHYCKIQSKLGTISDTFLRLLNSILFDLDHFCTSKFCNFYIVYLDPSGTVH